MNKRLILPLALILLSLGLVTNILAQATHQQQPPAPLSSKVQGLLAQGLRPRRDTIRAHRPNVFKKINDIEKSIMQLAHALNAIEGRVGALEGMEPTLLPPSPQPIPRKAVAVAPAQVAPAQEEIVQDVRETLTPDQVNRAVGATGPITTLPIKTPDLINYGEENYD